MDQHKYKVIFEDFTKRLYKWLEEGKNSGN